MIILQPFPASPAAYRADRGFRYPILIGKLSQRLADGVSDGDHLLGGNPVTRHLLSVKHGSVQSHIRDIIRVRFPRQIAQSVVGAVAVKVRYFVTNWRLTQERPGDDPMDRVRARDTAHCQTYATIDAFVRLAGLKDIPNAVTACVNRTRSFGSFYASSVARSIVWSKRYLSPLFVVINGISHSAVLSRGGQGRALLKQRSGPLSYGTAGLAMHANLPKTATGLQGWIRDQAAIDRNPK